MDLRKAYQNLKLAFEKFDVDGNGKISAPELSAVMSRVVNGGAPMSVEEVRNSHRAILPLPFSE